MEKKINFIQFINALNRNVRVFFSTTTVIKENLQIKQKRTARANQRWSHKNRSHPISIAVIVVVVGVFVGSRLSVAVPLFFPLYTKSV